MKTRQKITPCLWFGDNAEEAVDFYLSIFEGSRILGIQRYGEAGPGPKGSVMAITFELRGQEFIALNGGPMFKLSEAISLFVKCDSQAELDRFWDQLLASGEAQQCGWLKDRFGLSWQIVPSVLEEMLQDEDAEKSGRVMEALFKMVKLDIGALQAAYNR